jgi:hypothetical protein
MDCISHIDVQELGYEETCLLVDSFGRPINRDSSCIFAEDRYAVQDGDADY